MQQAFNLEACNLTPKRWLTRPMIVAENFSTLLILHGRELCLNHQYREVRLNPYYPIPLIFKQRFRCAVQLTVDVLFSATNREIGQFGMDLRNLETVM